MPKQLTDTEIAMRIVPTRLRWPSPETAKTIAWDRLREAVDLLHGLVRAVDNNCQQAEQDIDLSPEGIARRRTELGRQALTELANFKPLQIAEKAALENLDYLEKKMVDLPQPPTNVADVALAQEIRQYVRGQKSPIDFAAKSMSDPRVLSAILNAPAFLSGLGDTEWNMVRERARTAMHPEQAQMQKWLMKARDELREGVAATKRMLLERCEMGEEKPIREPLSVKPLAAAKTATAA
jgi:hypothetical protein